MIIAVDGFTASGKGTLSKKIAAALDYHFLDTGVLYRIVAYLTKQAVGKFDDVAAAGEVAANLSPAQISEFSDSLLIRTEEISQGSSIVANMIEEVRKPLVHFQRKFAQQRPGAVLDGRDIGNFICPEADVKLFITGTLEVRAMRRFNEQTSRGAAVSFGDVKREMAIKDKRDSVRTFPVKDSYIIDTSDLTADAVFKKAMDYIRTKKHDRR